MIENMYRQDRFNITVACVSKPLNYSNINFNRIGKLQKFEVPKKVKLCSDLWTPETELVTAALKLRRHSIKAFYINDIKQMYT